jgi:hypothetical protein
MWFVLSRGQRNAIGDFLDLRKLQPVYPECRSNVAMLGDCSGNGQFQLCGHRMASSGTISNTGLLTAPPEGGNVTVTATSTQANN